MFVEHEEAILHPAGIAAAQIGGQLRTVCAGLIGATLEVLVLVEDDLKTKHFKTLFRVMFAYVSLYLST